ncbi:Hint domain-containing protein [Microvirga sp. VF16]|uniref:Hint domain-containing protein n=1 Tax=Microvirga sp. VF16 TaxID=2807101 RepID=UPI00193E9650|nr:Hint domain-containing protein [Microvirga sp. VF16]QRM35652.1 Hint domain-containing protein [Microvirga sp. VF16]
MADTRTFTHTYDVRFNGTTYTVEQKDGGSATISDNLGSDSALTLGEVTGDQFTYNSATYTYVGAVGNGFIASTVNPKNNNTEYVLFTSDSTAKNTTVVPQPGTSTVICFLPGTQITTAQGQVPIETLKRGDLVQTADGRTVPVRWIGRQTVSTFFADPLRVLPICIKAGALAENVPSRDLYVSPDHAILIDDILVHASALVNGTSIVRAPAPAQTFTYYHVELADHSLLLADNVPAESFIDNVDRMAFDNWDEHEALDETAPLVEMAYPRAKAARQVPVAIRERLAARGQGLFGAVATRAA